MNSGVRDSTDRIFADIKSKLADVSLFRRDQDL